MNAIENQIYNKLNQSFEPTHLEVINESYMHSVSPGSETHFKVTLVSPQFEGKRQVQRHQAIYSCLKAELEGAVHALALHTFSVIEWDANNMVPQSPECLGGSKHDH